MAEDGETVEYQPVNAVLFPFFVLFIGVGIYHVLGRYKYARAIPYTAAMFLLGTIIGVGVERAGNENILSQSIRMWLNIDSEVLLTVFLPGLLFKDAVGVKLHLFWQALFQCLTFAFPLVLAGACLTALVFYFIFPYNWSWNFAMTGGSILAATDTVAVGNLLNQLGAPPRLKIHMLGEGLLNDGSAVVFYTLFSSMYFYELGLPGLEGRDFDGKSGTALFFRMSLGGACIGFGFGLGLVFCLKTFSSRLDREQCVVEVSATLAFAYLVYYTSETLAETSGFIGTVSMGITVLKLGRSYLNNPELFEDFWELVEWVLNSVLFTLGGALWGSIIANMDPKPGREFTGKDWGYLFLLYVCGSAIRFIIFGGAYPITKNIGLGTCWQEYVFMSFSGLRGAVGISLALSIHNKVLQAEALSPGEEEYDIQTERLYGFIGGYAFLTLIINGIAAGPLLKKLGLVDISSVRRDVLAYHKANVRKVMVVRLVQITQTGEFHNPYVIALVKKHVPYLDNLTSAEIKAISEQMNEGIALTVESLDEEDLGEEDVQETDRRDETSALAGAQQTVSPESPHLQEVRLLFIELLRAEVRKQSNDGELNAKEFKLLKSALNFAADDVWAGKSLSSWDHAESLAKGISRQQHHKSKLPSWNWAKWKPKHWNWGEWKPKHSTEKMNHDVRMTLGFYRAHFNAQNHLSHLAENGNVGAARMQVIRESEADSKKAIEVFKSFPRKDRLAIISHTACIMTINAGVSYLKKLIESRALRPQEGEQQFAVFQKALREIDRCKHNEDFGDIVSDNILTEEEERMGLSNTTQAEDLNGDSADAA